ncbi:MAG: AAA family ATPase [Nitrospirae bacterium]|nr:AAA family ATPase [Nitrospirota bacterium]
MDYFKLLNLKKEPFSNSPDLEFFYPSQMHIDCLQKLEMAIRFKRGLNVILGDVGTGKTTLCRQLIMRFDGEQDKPTTEIHLIMDPSFKNAEEFLVAIEKALGLYTGEAKSELKYKEEIKRYLYAKGVDEGKIVVLVIDEGQKIPTFCLEILRELLNYETGKYKLLQIVIFAQNEFNDILQAQKNLLNRVNLCYQLKPLSFIESCQMIKYRIENASNEQNRKKSLFTLPALYAVYRETKGYPRTINMLCHHVMVGLIVKSKKKASWAMVRFCSEVNLPGDSSADRRKKTIVLTSLLIVFAVAIAAYDLLSLRKYVGSGGFASEIVPLVVSNQANSINGSNLKAEPDVTKKQDSSMLAAAAEKKIEPVVPTADIQKPETQVVPVRDIERPEAQMPAKPLPVVSDENMPEVLGVITVPAGDTVINLLHSIYGNYSGSLIDAFLKVNPDVKDVNVIGAGKKVYLPAFRQENKLPSRQGRIFVQVASTKSIERAYELYNSYPKNQPAVSVFPIWNKKEGLVFMLLLKNSFTDARTAQTSLKTIPASVATNGKLIEKWDKNTIFFHKTGEGA